MSYKNVHTKLENRIKGGMYLYRLVEVTVEFLKNVTWNEILGWHIYLNGSTKFQELAILMAFFYCNLNLNKTYKMVGYSDANGTGQSVKAVTFRLDRNCCESYIDLYEMLVEAGKLERKQLNTTLFKLLLRKRVSRVGKESAKRIAIEAITKYGSAPKAGKKLGVEASLLSFWANYA